MTNAYVPTAVVLNALTREGSVPAACFRFAPEAGVRLEVLDERWGEVARTMFRDGVTAAEGRRVMAAQGEAFMRALLEPGRLTYYHFVDQSSDTKPERRPHPEPVREPHAGWELCPECAGKRFCQACDGQGWWSAERRCRMCDGTGECFYCGGGGEVRVPPPEA